MAVIILADHDRQMYSLILRDRICLNEVIIRFLIILCIDLDPTGISCAHSIGVVTVDIDRSGKCSVD